MPISKVYNMDCMDYMKSIPDKFFELAIVDPPYGINAPNMSMGSNMNRRHAQEERFRRECFGEIKTPEGIIVQQNLF